MTSAFCTILVMLVRIFSFVTKTKFRPNMKTSTLGALLNHKVCISSRGMQAQEAKSATYNMLNQNWLSVGCECVLYIFLLYVFKLALNMFSWWQIYYSKYTFYMQIEACDLHIFVGLRGASPPWPPQSGLRPEPDQEAAAPWTPCSYLVSPNVGISAWPRTLHENHENWYPRKFKPFTVYCTRQMPWSWLMSYIFTYLSPDTQNREAGADAGL